MGQKTGDMAAPRCAIGEAWGQTIIKSLHVYHYPIYFLFNFNGKN